MIYIRSVVAGIAALASTVAVLGTISLAIIVRSPQLAMRIFPAQNFDVQWGAYYYVNFPLWQILTAGAVAFIIGFAWTYRGASTRI